MLFDKYADINGENHKNLPVFREQFKLLKLNSVKIRRSQLIMNVVGGKLENVVDYANFIKKTGYPRLGFIFNGDIDKKFAVEMYAKLCRRYSSLDMKSVTYRVLLKEIVSIIFFRLFHF